MITKRCNDCGIEKSLDDFYVHKKMADGHLNSCKECRVSYMANRPKERIAEIERRRNQKPARKAAHKKSLQKWRRENPEKPRAIAREWYKNNPEMAKANRDRYPGKRKARSEVRTAINNGSMTKLPCSICGAKKVEGHHSDYSKPLDVRWLCKKHHNDIHKFENWLDYFIGEAA